MKEHKNPKVLSEGLLWMVSAVEDFGVAHLKLKVFMIFPSQYFSFLKIYSLFSSVIYLLLMLKRDTYVVILQELIDFCKDVGLQSSAAATRNATIKLLGSLHKFVGPGETFVFSKK